MPQEQKRREGKRKERRGGWRSRESSRSRAAAAAPAGWPGTPFRPHSAPRRLVRLSFFPCLFPCICLLLPFFPCPFFKSLSFLSFLISSFFSPMVSTSSILLSFLLCFSFSLNILFKLFLSFPFPSFIPLSFPLCPAPFLVLWLLLLRSLLSIYFITLSGLQPFHFAFYHFSGLVWFSLRLLSPPLPSFVLSLSCILNPSPFPS